MVYEIIYNRKRYEVIYYGMSQDGDIQILIQSEDMVLDVSDHIFNEVQKMFLEKHRDALIVAEILSSWTIG